MQRFTVVVILVSLSVAQALQFQREPPAAHRELPVTQVINLLNGMKQDLMQDARHEQMQYDKYACWCEDTLKRKAKLISDGKARLDELNEEILKGVAGVQSHKAEIGQLEKEIAENIAGQKEATEMRNKEHKEYLATRLESEQSIGALEQAIKVFSDATGDKKGFLQTLTQENLVTAAAGVRKLIQGSAVTKSMTQQDITVVQSFVAKPDQFMPGAALAQVGSEGSNPFGDYAPKSTQIQGILKGMYDTFATDLEQANAEEADHQKSYEELTKTKTAELKSLKASLIAEKDAHGSTSSELAADKSENHDLSNSVSDAEEFFEVTKTGCRKKAKDWNERTTLRTQEQLGIDKAIAILTNKMGTFEKAAEIDFLQVASKHSKGKPSVRSTAYAALKKVTQQVHSLALAEIAAAVKTGGAFDKVIVMIKHQLQVLDAEEKEDIKNKDRCELAMYNSHYESQGLIDEITRAQQAIKRFNAKQDKIRGKIGEMEDLIAGTDKELEDLYNARQEEIQKYKEASHADKVSYDTIQSAIEALGEFYTDNRIEKSRNGVDNAITDLSLAQKRQEPEPADELTPEYKVDPDKAPDTKWKDGQYDGAQRKQSQVVAIMEMLKEDITDEMKVAENEEKENKEDYEKARDALRDQKKKQTAAKSEFEGQMAEMEAKEQERVSEKTQEEGDLSISQQLERSLSKDCAWTKTGFADRREKRQLERDGLKIALDYLLNKSWGVVEGKVEALSQQKTQVDKVDAPSDSDEDDLSLDDV